MPAGEEDPRSRRRTRRRNAAEAKAPDRFTGEDVCAQPLDWTRQKTHIGVIKHFDVVKKYGFIACHEIKEVTQKDVFVHERQLKNFKLGDQVQFRVKKSHKGELQANDLREVEEFCPYSAPARSFSGGATGSRDEATLSENAGVHLGQVKKIEKGYGFLACEELFVMFGCDVFVEKDLIAGFQVGDTVRFSIKVNNRDQPQAMDLVWVGGSAKLPSSPGFGGPTAPEGGLREISLPPRLGTLCEGYIKKIDVEKGYGFITSHELFNYYQADVYVDKRELRSFAVGDRVLFSMKENKRGQPQACNVNHYILEPYEEDPQEDFEMLLALKDGPREEHLAGTIKSFDAENGYGFISSPEITARYSRDVFLHARQIGSFKPGDHVTFSVSENQHGRPQAHDLKEAPSTVAWLAGADADTPPSESTPEHVGDIKSFNAAKGYGFIECPALFGQFGRDVFIHQNQFDGRRVGDRVSFKVLVNNKGQPQACEVVLVAEADVAATTNSSSVGRERHVSSNEFEGCAPEELDRKLLRACASARMESLELMDKLLSAGASPNSRDVTGQLALVVSAFNVRNSEKKCRMLLEHKADVQAMHNDDLTVLQWARERINGNFAAYLEAVSKGEAAEYVVVLNQDAPEEY